MRSRKLGRQTQVILENMQDRIAEQEKELDKLQTIVNDWKVTNQPSWNLMSGNYPEIAEMITTFKKEGGFVGLKSYDSNPLGNAQKSFTEMMEEVEEMERKIIGINDDMRLDQEEATRHIDCLQKAIKQLQD